MFGYNSYIAHIRWPDNISCFCNLHSSDNPKYWDSSILINST